MRGGGGGRQVGARLFLFLLVSVPGGRGRGHQSSGDGSGGADGGRRAHEGGDGREEAGGDVGVALAELLEHRVDILKRGVDLATKLGAWEAGDTQVWNPGG